MIEQLIDPDFGRQTTTRSGVLCRSVPKLDITRHFARGQHYNMQIQHRHLQAGSLPLVFCEFPCFVVILSSTFKITTPLQSLILHNHIHIPRCKSFDTL